jgi:hypothetical protein
VLEKPEIRPNEGNGAQRNHTAELPHQHAILATLKTGDAFPDGASRNGTKHSTKATHGVSRTPGAVVPYTNGTVAATQDDDNLLTLPLQTVDDSFDAFMDTARAFGSEEYVRRVKSSIEDFKRAGSVGQKLQARLREKADDPRTKNRLGDVYAASLWLQPQIPVRSISTFFVSRVLSDWQHTQAERAALISLTAFAYKQDLNRGTVEC